MEEIIEIVEKHFSNLLEDVDKFGDYWVVVPIDDRWEYELPKNITSKIMETMPFMQLHITGWTRENSYYDKDRQELVIVTAFGEDENSAVFDSYDVKGLFTGEKVPIYSKVYNANRVDSIDDGHTIRSLMGEPEPDDTSMNAMMKHNPKLFKKDK